MFLLKQSNVISGGGDSRAGSAASNNLFSSLSILKAEKGLFIYFYFQLNMETNKIQCKLEIEIKKKNRFVISKPPPDCDPLQDRR
jgi:hypothetical protein